MVSFSVVFWTDGVIQQSNTFPEGQGMLSSRQELLPLVLHSEVVSLIFFPHFLPTLEWV